MELSLLSRARSVRGHHDQLAFIQGPHIGAAITLISEAFPSPLHPLHLVCNGVIKIINETVVNN